MHMSDKFVEIIGNVKDDMTIKALTSINLGDSLGAFRRLHNHEAGANVADMKAVQALIEFAQTEKGEGILSS
jgi:replication factor A3